MSKTIKINDLIDEDFIIDINAENKNDALHELIDVICKSEKITDCKKFEKEIFSREKLMSTGVGYNIAVPHARHSTVEDFVLAIGRKKDGIHYKSIDDKPVKLIFMIGASDHQDKEYIKLLSRLFLRLKNKRFVNKLLEAKDATEIVNIFKG